MSAHKFRLKSRGTEDIKTRYRPQTLAEIVPTVPVSRLMSLIKKLPARVYLFDGPTGTGKTTCARIVARALQCDKPTDDGPCMECKACRGMESNGDYCEINVGDLRTIDAVRDIAGQMNFAPMFSKYRIFVFDEVHQLTAASQECLLKVLEEPKAHLLIFMCTTRTQGLKPTLLHRAQRIGFKTIDKSDAMEVIDQIVSREAGASPDEAMRQAIYDSSGGSVRLLMNNVQAYLEGGFQAAAGCDEESTDDVKDLMSALERGEWSVVAAILSRSTVRSQPESARIGVENLARTGCLTRPDPTRMGASPVILKYMIGTLSADPTISQYNHFVFRCLKVCQDIQNARKSKVGG